MSRSRTTDSNVKLGSELRKIGPQVPLRKEKKKIVIDFGKRPEVE